MIKVRSRSSTVLLILSHGRGAANWAATHGMLAGCPAYEDGPTLQARMTAQNSAQVIHSGPQIQVI